MGEREREGDGVAGEDEEVMGEEGESKEGEDWKGEGEGVR